MAQNCAGSNSISMESAKCESSRHSLIALQNTRRFASSQERSDKTCATKALSEIESFETFFSA